MVDTGWVITSPHLTTCIFQYQVTEHDKIPGEYSWELLLYGGGGGGGGGRPGLQILTLIHTKKCH